MTDRAAAERSIRVVSPAAMTGSYDWVSPSTVHFVPDELWPAHSQIKLMVGGMPRSFETGPPWWPSRTSPRTRSR